MSKILKTLTMDRLTKLAELFYNQGRADQLEHDFPDVGWGFTKSFTDYHVENSLEGIILMENSNGEEKE